MRVLMLSKALVVGEYQRKLEEIASLPGVELTAIVPPFWQETRVGRTALERKHLSGYEMIVEEMVFNGHHHVHFYPRLARHVRSIRPDVFHIDEEAFNLSTFQAMRLGRSVGAKCVFYAWANIHRVLPPPFSLFERYNHSRADWAIAGNRDAEEILRKKGFKRPITMIPQFGVDPSVFYPSRQATGASAFTVGYVGRLVPEKGLLDLMEAFSQLGSDARLLLVGGGVLQPQLETMAQEKGLRDRVEFTGPVPSGQMPVYYNRMDVLVLPSLTRPNWREQFGRALTEAMACGVPVVGSSSGEIPNVIANAGLVFPEGDSGELAQRLKLLRDDAAVRSKLAEAGRQRTLEHFTQARIAEAHYEVYQAMVRGGA